MTEPCADRVDVDARAKEVRGGRVSNDVRADRLLGERRHTMVASLTYRVTVAWTTNRVTAIRRRLTKHRLVWRPSLRQRSQRRHGRGPERTVSRRHPGYEAILITEGTVNLYYSTLEDPVAPVSATENELCHFDSTIPHRLENPSPTVVAEFFLIRFYRDGDRETRSGVRSASPKTRSSRNLSKLAHSATP